MSFHSFTNQTKQTFADQPKIYEDDPNDVSFVVYPPIKKYTEFPNVPKSDLLLINNIKQGTDLQEINLIYTICLLSVVHTIHALLSEDEMYLFGKKVGYISSFISELFLFNYTKILPFCSAFVVVAFLLPRATFAFSVIHFVVASAGRLQNTTFLWVMVLLLSEIILSHMGVKSHIHTVCALMCINEVGMVMLNTYPEISVSGKGRAAKKINMLPTDDKGTAGNNQNTDSKQVGLGAAVSPFESNRFDNTAATISALYNEVRELGEKLPKDFWKTLCSIVDCPFTESRANPPNEVKATGENERQGDQNEQEAKIFLPGIAEVQSTATRPIEDYPDIPKLSILESGSNTTRTGLLSLTLNEPFGIKRKAPSLELSKLADWNFNVFNIFSEFPGRPLFVVAYSIAYRHGLLDRLNIESLSFAHFLTCLENKYNMNPYHSSIHAADMCQSMYFLLSRSGYLDCLSPFEFFVMLVAAAGHDADHPGAGNNLLEAASFSLDVTYAGQAPAERHSLSIILQLVSETNLLEMWTTAEIHRFRNILTNLVLATDMTVHGSICKDLRNIFQERLDKGIEHTNIGLWEHKGEFMSAFIHIADIFNTMRPTRLYLHWSERLMEEWRLAGDAAEDLDIVTNMVGAERKNPRVIESQEAFIKYIVFPLIEGISNVFPSLVFLKRMCMENVLTWGRIPEIMDKIAQLAHELPAEFKSQTLFIEGLKVLRKRAIASMEKLHEPINSTNW